VLGYLNPSQQLCVDEVVGRSANGASAGAGHEECSKRTSRGGSSPVYCMSRMTGLNYEYVNGGDVHDHVIYVIIRHDRMSQSDDEV
jgi:hypothetical protein